MNSHADQHQHQSTFIQVNSKKKLRKLLMGMNIRIIIRDRITQTLTSVSNSIVQTWKEAKIAEKVESGVNTVKTKLTDPALQEEVKQKAQAGWSWLSSSATSLWNAAKATASSLASEFMEQPEQASSQPTQTSTQTTEEVKTTST